MGKRFSADNSFDFFAAADAGDLITVSRFLEDGFPVDQTREGRTALHIAAGMGFTEMVAALISTGADVNRTMTGEKNTWARTALNNACNSGHINAIHLLLDAGANPRIPDSSGNTAAHVLANAWVTVAARKPGVDKSEFANFLSKTLARMLETGIEINQTNLAGETLLHRLVDLALPPMAVSLLLEQGANHGLRDSKGMTALHRAVLSESRAQSVPVLLSHGADINAAAYDGSRPLHHCCAASLPVLLAGRPELEAQDIYGQTALARMLMRDVFNRAFVPQDIAVLLEAGASMDTPDFGGVTPANILKSKKLTGIESFVSANRARTAMRQSAASVIPAP